MENEDQILLDELKKGDFFAYGLIFEKYFKALCAKAYFMLDDEMDAEDLVQNLFISVWQKQNYLSIESSLKAYLFRAVHNRCLAQLKRRKRMELKFDHYMQDTTDPGNEAVDHHISSESGADVAADYREACEKKINNIFKELPLKRQEAFKLVYLQDKRYKQAAEEMGISVNSIKTHLKMATKILQEKLNNLK